MVDANLQWRVGAEGDGGAPAGGAQAYDEEAHQLVSFDGRTLAGGARVLPAGPRLCSRAPKDPAAGAAASPEQLLELRRRKCRQVVVAAGSD